MSKIPVQMCSNGITAVSFLHLKGLSIAGKLYSQWNSMQLEVSLIQKLVIINNIITELQKSGATNPLEEYSFCEPEKN